MGLARGNIDKMSHPTKKESFLNIQVLLEGVLGVMYHDFRYSVIKKPDVNQEEEADLDMLGDNDWADVGLSPKELEIIDYYMNQNVGTLKLVSNIQSNTKPKRLDELVGHANEKT